MASGSGFSYYTEKHASGTWTTFGSCASEDNSASCTVLYIISVIFMIALAILAVLFFIFMCRICCGIFHHITGYFLYVMLSPRPNQAYQAPLRRYH